MMFLSHFFSGIRMLGLIALCCSLGAPARGAEKNGAIGLFSDQCDVGKPALGGAAGFDRTTAAYHVRGAGQNIWNKTDAFHYVWIKMSGDLSLEAAIKLGAGANPHRKGCLMIRQSLDGDSAYVDAAVHAAGLTSLQYRDTAGESTHEIQSNLEGPERVALTKQGDTFFMSVAGPGEPLRRAGGSIKLKLREPFYVGLAVCSHGDAEMADATFSEVTLKKGDFKSNEPPHLESTLEVVDIGSGNRRVVYHTNSHIEAPNWTPDGKFFLFNREGRIWRLPVEGGEPEALDTDFATACNNDHGISFDGRQLAISSRDEKSGKSLIYILPIGGGTPRQVTPVGHSYWHGWSPDGKTLVFCGERGGEYDVYAIPAAGGAEKRLTTALGLDDGPEYSPDGQWIYFNSVRTGLMQIWRMRPDGSGQEQVTHDEANNWFAHFSPGGKNIAFLTFDKSVEGHPPNKDVELRLMPVAGGPIQVLARVFGGQGTLNVNSWAPNGKKLAFVSYQLINMPN